jgi:hypothetical protein
MWFDEALYHLIAQEQGYGELMGGSTDVGDVSYVVRQHSAGP